MDVDLPGNHTTMVQLGPLLRRTLLKAHFRGTGRRPWGTIGSAPCSSAANAMLQTRKSVDILDAQMSYLDTGTGDNAVLFLHGNPTSAYLWRNIMPHVADKARCLAPDLVGMGHSSKLKSNDYSFDNHYRYLNEWIEKMQLPEKFTIVGHDWGSALGFQWGYKNQERVQAIVYMEAFANAIPSWEDWPKIARRVFQTLRTEKGEEMILKKNFFVEVLFPRSIFRELSEQEMDEYRKPYIEEGEARRPTLTWPRSIPVTTDGPKEIVDMVEEYGVWLKDSHGVPKLYIDAEPGFFSPVVRRAVADWPNQKVIQVKGLHFIQEDSPHEIGKGISEFLTENVFPKA